MTTRPLVEILLATYNGERFLCEQVDSLLAQTWRPLRITVSDDGSTDSTPAILQRLAAAHPGIIRLLPTTQRFGSAQANFLHLMQSATAPYVCFADQDDVWMPNKIEESMQAMSGLEQTHHGEDPLLVFTDLRVVDSELKTIAASMRAHLRLRSESAQRLERLLGQTVVTGCTMLINQAMVRIACQMPPQATMHDRWIALLAASLGASAYIDQPTVLYRQHDRNVIGATTSDSTLSGVATRTADGTGRRAERLRSQRQARALLRLHGAQMKPTQAKILQSYLASGTSESAFRRLWLTICQGFYRATPAQTLALLTLLAANRVEDR